MILLLLAACGQFVPAEQALTDASTDTIAADVELATRVELVQAERLAHYAQDGLLRYHTADVQWGGGAARGVDYDGILASAEARVTLADALANLGAVDPSALADRGERLAFWMNQYNVWVVQGIVTTLQADPDYPGVESDGWALFNTAFVQAGGLELTLNQVEHCVIRGDPQSFELYVEDPALADQLWAWHDELWDGGVVDARIHVGINCASVGCPDITAGAWQPETLDADLDAAAARFLAHPGKGAGPDGISTLFSWFAGDFEASHGGAAAFIDQHRAGGTSGVTLDSYLPYDWALNDL